MLVLVCVCIGLCVLVLKCVCLRVYVYMYPCVCLGRRGDSVSSYPQEPATTLSIHLPWKLCIESPKKFENETFMEHLLVPKKIFPREIGTGVHGAD